MFPKIVQVVPTEEHTVYAYFEDGKIECYDVKPLLGNEVFAVLREITFFINACTIMNDTLAWDVSGNRDNSKCIDIDPDTLYMLDAVKERIDRKIKDSSKRKSLFSNFVLTPKFVGYWQHG